MKAPDILECLKRWRPYKTGIWGVFEEFCFHTGEADRRKIDLWMIDQSPARGFKKFAFEIKTSMSDLNRELSDPQKNKLAYEHSNFFYFVGPVGVLTKARLPHGCGLIEIHDGGESGLSVYDSRLFRAGKPTIPAIYKDASPPTWGLVVQLMNTKEHPND